MSFKRLLILSTSFKGCATCAGILPLARYILSTVVLRSVSMAMVLTIGFTHSATTVAFCFGPTVTGKNRASGVSTVSLGRLRKL